MKSFFIIALCLAGQVCSKSLKHNVPNNCVEGPRPNNPCEAANFDTLYPDPSNPSQFYSCTPYGLQCMVCPAGLVFDVQANRCEYSTSPVPTTKAPEPEITTTQAPEKPEPEPEVTEAPEEPEPEPEVTEAPEEPEPEPEVTEAPEEPEPEPEITEAPEEPEPEPEVTEAPEEPEPEPEITEAPEEPEPEPEVTEAPEEPEVEEPAPLPPSNCLEVRPRPNYPCDADDYDTLYPDPNNAGQFFSCTPYGLQCMVCPADLVFDVPANRCEYATTTTEKVPEPEPTEAPEEPEPEPTEAPEEPEPEPTEAPEEPETTTTQAPETTTTQAPETTTTQAPETTTPQAPETTKAPAPGGNCSSVTCDPNPDIQYYPNPSECTSFCQCSNGVPYYQPCPAGLHFNPTLNVCDWPQDAGCRLGAPKECSEITCESGVQYYAHPSRCNAFCQCSNGTPYKHECPSGLEFNTNLNVCDWPASANCQVSK